MKRKTLSILLVLCMALSLVPALAFNTNAASYETAIFPAPQLYVTQLAYESYSHGSQNAIDIAPGGNVFAPFTGTVVYRDPDWGFVALQSNDKVYFADGSLDYMTVGFMHDENISDISDGQIINRGQPFYQAGGMGDGNPKAYDVHVHICVWRGKHTPTNSNGHGNMYAFDAFFVNTKRTSVVQKGAMNPANYMTNGAPSNYSNKWVLIDRDVVEDDKPNPTTDSALYAPGSNVTVRWNTVKNAYYYYVIINKDGKNIFNRSVGGDLSYTISNAEAGSYEFFVQSYDRNGNGSGNVGCYFDVGYVGIPHPKTDKTVYKPGSKVTVSWDAVANAYYYYVIINKDGQNIFNRSVGGDLSYTFDSAESGSYEFFVQAYDRQGHGSGNVKCTFEVEYVGRPNPQTEKAVYTPGSDVTVTWEPVANVYYYYVIIHKDGHNIFNRSVNGSRSYLFENAEAGSYAFYVRAYDKTGNGSENVELLFDVAYTITLDANGGSCESTTVLTDSNNCLREYVVPTLDDHIFDGWYTAASGGTKVTENTVFSSDATIYAHWVETDPCANGHTWDAGVITQQPTGTAEGVKTFTCTVCGETRTESVPKLENPFVDVAAGKFYYDPVLWAISQDPQITTGVTQTTFEPDRVCTRAQVVTFLWRAKGCPEPTTTVNPFKDVSASAYYYKAVLWAVENDITTGYADGTFRPDGECTRAHVVTFLWRLEGSPAPQSASNPFKDVPAGQFYTNAALWAVKNNITTGYAGGTFRPETACTRGQIVTFLYRAYN